MTPCRCCTRRTRVLCSNIPGLLSFNLRQLEFQLASRPSAIVATLLFYFFNAHFRILPIYSNITLPHIRARRYVTNYTNVKLFTTTV